MRGTIEEVKSVPGKYGPWQKIKVQGTWLGTDFKCPALAPGQVIEFEAVATPDGKYWNAKNVRPEGVPVQTGPFPGPIPTAAAAAPLSPWSQPTVGLPAQAALPARPVASGGPYAEGREVRIVRQNAGSTAATLIAARMGDTRMPPPLSTVFTEWEWLAERIFQTNFEGYKPKMVNPANPAMAPAASPNTDDEGQEDDDVPF